MSFIRCEEGGQLFLLHPQKFARDPHGNPSSPWHPAQKGQFDDDKKKRIVLHEEQHELSSVDECSKFGLSLLRQKFLNNIS
jgi:hypothetical protein